MVGAGRWRRQPPLGGSGPGIGVNGRPGHPIGPGVPPWPKNKQA